jgi:hypothetical protein
MSAPKIKDYEVQCIVRRANIAYVRAAYTYAKEQIRDRSKVWYNPQQASYAEPDQKEYLVAQAALREAALTHWPHLTEANRRHAFWTAERQSEEECDDDFSNALDDLKFNKGYDNSPADLDVFMMNDARLFVADMLDLRKEKVISTRATKRDRKKRAHDEDDWVEPYASETDYEEWEVAGLGAW